MDQDQASQSNQKQAYDEKRKEKEEAVKKAFFKRRVRKIAIWSLVIAVFLLLAKYLWDANQAATQVQRENEEVAEVMGDFFASQGQDHIANDAEHPDYNTNPPTSGPHYSVPKKGGVYSQEFPDELLIHNLEHGHIWISYKPDLDKETIAKLEAVARRFPDKIVVAPRAKNDSPIALAAWEYLLKLDTYEEAQILGFIKAHRGNGPEDVPDMGI